MNIKCVYYVHDNSIQILFCYVFGLTFVELILDGMRLNCLHGVACMFRMNHQKWINEFFSVIILTFRMTRHT